MRRLILPCIMALAPVGTLAQERAESPRLARLEAELASRGSSALGEFWKEAEREGTPLVEPAAGGRLRVTFLWRGGGDLEPIAVFSAATGWTPPTHLLQLMPGTDVWHGTYLVPTDARFTYRISLHDNLRTYYADPDWRERAARFRLDPLDADTVSLGGSIQASLFEGPDVLTSDLVREAADVPRGRLVEITVPSSMLHQERAVQVYVPPGDSGAPPAERLPLVVVLDGGSYTSVVPTPTILDNLIARDRLPRVLAAFVRQTDRTRELSADSAFTRFLAEELVPELRTRFHATDDPARTTLAGSSLGGLAAAFAALTRPDVFGAVLAQSGAFWWAPPDAPEPGWLMRAFATRPRAPLRFYLEVGRLEREPIRGGPSMLDLTRHMRDVLCARGYPVGYRETGGDHAYISWRHSFGEALATIVLPEQRPSDGVREGCTEDGAG